MSFNLTKYASPQVQDVKATRLLASEITQTGAKVHDLLANEATER